MVTLKSPTFKFFEKIKGIIIVNKIGNTLIILLLILLILLLW